MFSLVWLECSQCDVLGITLLFLWIVLYQMALGHRLEMGSYRLITAINVRCLLVHPPRLCGSKNGGLVSWSEHCQAHDDRLSPLAAVG
jgi:hypothetical protein